MMVRISEAIQEKSTIKRLKLLYKISQTINSSLDLDYVLNSLIDEVITATNAERGLIMMFDESMNLNMHTARGIGNTDIDTSDFKISQSIINRTITEDTPLLTSNAQLDERFNNRGSIRIHGLRSVICVPIKTRATMLGVIYIDNRFRNGIFSEEDLELLVAIASSAAIAIENARLYQLAIIQARMRRELQMAREVQENLIPRFTPKINGWEFAACWKPAHEVSGDFYDFIPLPSGKVGLLVADVSDKGMPAAMFMTLSRSIIRSVVGQNGLPSEDISKANRFICRDADENMFVTFFYAEIDAQTNTLTYVNAGHNPPIFISSKTGTHQLVKKTGMAVGIEPESEYEQDTLDFSPGDLLIIYTDGVTDLETNGNVFGLDGIEKVLAEKRVNTADEIVHELERKICALSSEETLRDDITLVVARRAY